MVKTMTRSITADDPRGQINGTALWHDLHGSSKGAAFQPGGRSGATLRIDASERVPGRFRRELEISDTDAKPLAPTPELIGTTTMSLATSAVMLKPPIT